MNIHRSRFVDFTPHTISALSFSHSATEGVTPSDLRLAVGRSNGDIEIWNPRYGWYQEQILRGAKGRTIEGLVWARWESVLRLFSIGGSTVLTEWDLKRGVPLKNYDCNAGVIWSVAVNHSYSKIAVGCDNGSVVLIDILGGPGSLEYHSVLQRQNSRVLSINFHGDKLVVGGCADGKIRVWGLLANDKGRIIGSMKVDKSTKQESTLVWSVLVLDKQGQIVSGDSTGSVKFWDIEHYTLLQSFDSHEADVLCLTSDLNQEKVFSAGVDRKIINYNFVKKKQWVNSYSKLLHANDVRAIASFESKGLSLLVSAGVERTVLINSVRYFNSSIARKLPISVQYQNNLASNSSKRLIVMWQDQTVKLWKIFPQDTSVPLDSLDVNQKNFKLVSKLVLSEQENISNVAISDQGNLLAVGYLTSTKVFKLKQRDGKLAVVKLNLLCDKLQEIGSKALRFSRDGLSLILVNLDNEIITMDLRQNTTTQLQIDLPDLKTKSGLGYLNNIKLFKVSPDNTRLAIVRNNALDLVSLAEPHQHRSVARLSHAVSAIEFTSNDTLIAISVENKIYQWNVSGDQPQLTSWSNANSELIPSGFLNMKNKCIGISVAADDSKVWFWGADWLSYLDLSKNLPAQRQGLKRTHDGLSVYDELELAEISGHSSKDLDFPAVKAGQDVPFWWTTRYLSILKMGLFSNKDMYIIERPLNSLPSQAAFNTNHITF